MAQIIAFGSGGDELDLGLPGGTLHAAGTVTTTLNLSYGQDRVGESATSMPNSGVVRMMRTGYGGETITGQGLMSGATHEDINAVELNINKRISDPDELRAYPLTEDATVGGRTRAKVMLKSYSPGPRRQSAIGRIVQQFAIVFEVLQK